MSLTSFTFIGFALIALAAYHAVPARKYRRAALFLINAVFLASFAAQWRGLAPLLFFLVFGYVLLLVARRWNHKRIITVGIIVLVVLFAWLKRYAVIEFVPQLPFPYIVVGLSYILFRVIHLLIDTSSGAVPEKISPADYFNYVCFFPAFISGPVHRFQDFASQERGAGIKDYTGAEISRAFSRIINGYIKIILLSGFLFDFYQKFLSRHPAGLLPVVLASSVCVVCYTLYLYMNFSGYMDVVIGVGELFGFKLPENFNRPFAADNFLDFWSRWHITLSEWFRFYLFNPLLKILIQRWGSRRLTPYLGVLCYFATFTTMGVWHGSTPVFLIFGLFLGLGAGLNKLYELEMRKRLGKRRYGNLIKKTWYRFMGRGFTFGYFSLSLVCLWFDMKGFGSFFSALGFSGVMLMLIGVSASAGVVLFFSEKTLGLFAAAEGKLSPVMNSWFFQQGWLAAKLFFLSVALVLKFSSAPEFVYKGF